MTRVECVLEIRDKPSPLDTDELFVDIVTCSAPSVTLLKERAGQSDVVFEFEDGDLQLADIRNRLALGNEAPYLRLVLTDSGHARLKNRGIVAPTVPLELRVGELKFEVEPSLARAEDVSGAEDDKRRELRLAFRNRRLGIEQSELVDKVVGQLSWVGAAPAKVEQRKVLSPRYPTWLGARLLKLLSIAGIFLLLAAFVTRSPAVAALSAWTSAYSLALSFELFRWSGTSLGFIRFSQLGIDYEIGFAVASLIAAASLLNFYRKDVSPSRALAGSTLVFGALILLSFISRSQGVHSTLWTVTCLPLLVTALHIPFVLSGSRTGRSDEQGQDSE